MYRLGLIINPIAGMGGSVGLRGTDGVLEEALRRGAVPQAQERAAEALEQLLPLKDDLVLVTAPGLMGKDLAESMGFRTMLPEGIAAPLNGRTDAEDTARCTRGMLAMPEGTRPSLVLFAGGDGTARDIYRGVGLGTPCVGIPAGVKMHSPVYARNPEAAGQLALKFLRGEVRRLAELEVLDIDEEEYRKDVISTRLYGYLRVPDDSRFTQNRKEPTPLSEAAAIRAIGAFVADSMDAGTLYLIGAGTTTRGIMDELGLPYTLIGIDAVRGGRLAGADLYGKDLEELAQSGNVKLIVTVTGGQGYLFGRGNQQLSPDIIRAIGRENIMVIATPSKLAELGGRPLLTDTGDPGLDRSLSGWYRVITGYDTWTMCRVSR